MTSHHNPKFAVKHINQKIWVDKGREFSGDLATFCSQKGIEIYSTKIETKSALAVRNIRSLKSLIFKYMHEHDQCRYFDKLDQFVAFTNNRVNRMTKLAPVSVSQKDVNCLVSLCHTNAQKEPKFLIGHQVRIRRKIDTFHRSYKMQSTELFTIAVIPTNNLQLILSMTTTDNFTNLNSCDSLQIDFVNDGQAIRNC